MDIMRTYWTYLWLFLRFAVVEGLLVQDQVLFETQREGSSLVGDLLPDQGHVVQEDLKPFVTEESSVQEQPAGSKIVQKERLLCKGVIINGKCYQFFRGPMKAYEAEFYCQNNFPNGHLASVTSRYVHDQMMILMDKNGGRTRTWIGGLRYLETGRFIWLDGAHWNYADWLPGEPNNTIGVEHCVELLSNSKFNDMPCWDLRAYICSYSV